MINVKIDPAFDDQHMQGEYDEERYQQAETSLNTALMNFIAAGGRSDNLEAVVSGALENAGID